MYGTMDDMQSKAYEYYVTTHKNKNAQYYVTEFVRLTNSINDALN
jgi:hypothetical protein